MKNSGYYDSPFLKNAVACEVGGHTKREKACQPACTMVILGSICNSRDSSPSSKEEIIGSRLKRVPEKVRPGTRPPYRTSSNLREI